jgi:hypothetical protein
MSATYHYPTDLTDEQWDLLHFLSRTLSNRSELH